MMEYKGYVGRIEYDDEAGIFHGEVINTRDVITFQGTTVGQLRKALRTSVDDYVAFCNERGEEPEKPFSGQFVTRVGPDLHRRISLAAALSGKSLNAWVTEQLERGTRIGETAGVANQSGQFSTSTIDDRADASTARADRKGPRRRRPALNHPSSSA